MGLARRAAGRVEDGTRRVAHLAVEALVGVRVDGEQRVDVGSQDSAEGERQAGGEGQAKGDGSASWCTW